MNLLPLPALCGMEQQKEALALLAINRNLGGAIIVGERGTGKTQLVRSFAQGIEQPIVECPVHANEDQLLGAIHLEKGITSGQFVLEEGLLERAAGKWLFIDDIHLANEATLHLLSQAISEKQFVIERFGFSKVIYPDICLIGTMNPDEQLMSPQLIDRFGLYIEIQNKTDFVERLELLKVHRTFELQQDEQQNWSDERNEWKERISNASQRLANVQVPHSMLELAAIISLEANCPGHRADYLLIEAAKARAAFYERVEISEEDLRSVASFVLPHRMRNENLHEKKQQETIDENPTDKNNQDQSDKQERKQQPNKQFDNPTDEGQSKDSETTTEQSEQANESRQTDGLIQERTDGIDSSISIRPIRLKMRDKQKRKGSGKRALSRVEAKRGRQVKAQLPKGKVEDFSFFDTVRAAAPFQHIRPARPNVKVTILQEDFRDKIREKRTGTHLLFVVDASASMLAKQRMKAVKGAIFSLLQDAYQSRDHVSLIAFRDDRAEIILPFTRSIEAAQSTLENLPAGGKTPLSAGLEKSLVYLEQVQRRQPLILPFVILLTDGRTNVSMSDKKPFEEALLYGKLLADRSIKSLVIDTEEQGRRQFGLAKQIATAMDGGYWKLSELQAEEIMQAIRLHV